MTIVAVATMLALALFGVILSASMARWCFEDGAYGLGTAAAILGLIAATVGIGGAIAIAADADEQVECQP